MAHIKTLVKNLLCTHVPWWSWRTVK